MIVLMVRYTVQPGKREEFVKAINEVGFAAVSKGEKGNAGYDYFYPVDKEDELLLVEKWKSREDWQGHLQADHVKEFQVLKQGYVLSMVPELFEPLRV